jgi:Flp pilus assembly protein TadD
MNSFAESLAAAHAAYRQKRFAEAETACRGLLESAPGNADAMHLLGLVRKELGDLADGERWLRQSVALEPHRAEFQANLGNLLRRLGKAAEAAEAYRRALAANPRHSGASLGLGRALSEAGMFPEAEQHVRGLVTEEPANAQVWGALAVALEGQNKLGEAESAFRRALALDSNYVAAHHNLGALLSRLERAEEALVSLDRARQLGARSRETAYNRGRALMQLYRLDEAEQEFAQSVAMAPANIESQMALANVRFMKGDARFARDLASAAAADRENDRLQMLFADVLRRANDLPGSELVLRDLLARRGSMPEVRSALAVVLHESGKVKEAELHASEAATQRPRDPVLIENLVSVLLSMGRPADAKPFIATQRARAPADQRWIAYEATAARLAGDARYEELYDYAELVRSYELSAPRGWSSMKTFHEDLVRVLGERHRFKNHPLDQSLRNGTQSASTLLADRNIAIQALLAAFGEPIAAYREAIGFDETHPLRSRNKGKTVFAGCWSVKLGREGFHVNHVHPQGWVSSAYYVSVPEEVQDTSLRSGWIKFGEPRLPVPDAGPAHFVQPQEGRLVLFPSYMWHGTTPIRGAEPRLTVAFDVVSI